MNFWGRRMRPSDPETRLDETKLECWTILLLEAALHAGLSPLPVERLHTIFYLANVLSPVWKGREAIGAVLKRNDARPFQPRLQMAVDRLLGRGMISASGIRHVIGSNGGYRLEAAYGIESDVCGPALEAMRHILGKRSIASYAGELLLALSSLSDRQLDDASLEDATYGDQQIGPDNVVDYAEWLNRNSSANAAALLARHVPSQISPSPSETVHLYVRHLRERLQNVG